MLIVHYRLKRGEIKETFISFPLKLVFNRLFRVGVCREGVICGPKGVKRSAGSVLSRIGGKNSINCHCCKGLALFIVKCGLVASVACGGGEGRPLR